MKMTAKMIVTHTKKLKLYTSVTTINTCVMCPVTDVQHTSFISKVFQQLSNKSVNAERCKQLYLLFEKLKRQDKTK